LVLSTEKLRQSLTVPPFNQCPPVMKKLSVFLVDDSQINNMYMEDMLADMEHIEAVTVFYNPQQALEEFEALKNESGSFPDLILLDIRMPELDGYEFLEELENLMEDSTRLPLVFMLTSSQHKRDLEAFERFPCAKEYLNKPLEQEMLQALLERYF
jgi:CheY-like chemotaxis protein